MTRKEIFLALETHAWFGRLYKKLLKKEREFCLQFIDDHNSLVPAAFEEKVLRIYVGVIDRPKNAGIIIELLTCTNSEYRNLLLKFGAQD